MSLNMDKLSWCLLTSTMMLEGTLRASGGERELLVSPSYKLCDYNRDLLQDIWVQ